MKKKGFGGKPGKARQNLGGSSSDARMTMWEAIRQGKFIEWMFGTGGKKKKAGKKTVMNLALNDIVTYEEAEYIVKDKCTYNDGGSIWYEYTLDDNGKYLYLSVEDDDALEIGVLRKIDFDVDEPVPSKIKYDGNKYKLDEHSFAKVDTVGLRGKKEGVKVEYWDFECQNDDADNDLLSIEKWGGSDFEVYCGCSVKEYELKLLPGGGIDED